MTCEQRKDLIPLLPLGALDPAEVREIHAHLAAGCPVCEGRLAEADVLLSMLPMALPPVAPPAKVKEQLMARVRAGSSLPIGARATDAKWKIRPTELAMAALVLVSVGLSIALVSSQRNAANSLRTQLAQANVTLSRKDTQINQLQLDKALIMDAVRTVSSPTVQLVGLKGSAQPSARGVVYVDRPRRKLLFSGDGLKPPAPNKTYELWLVSGNTKIPIGTFEPDEKGQVALAVNIPADVGPLAAAAVTDEPAGGVPQPTGQFQIIGAAEQ